MSPPPLPSTLKHLGLVKVGQPTGSTDPEDRCSRHGLSLGVGGPAAIGQAVPQERAPSQNQPQDKELAELQDGTAELTREESHLDSVDP